MDLDVERSRISYSLSRVHPGSQAIWAMTDRRDAAVGVAQRLLAEVEALQRAIAQPVLKPGTVVRIPGPDVNYIVDKCLQTNGPKATLTFTTVDGLDWDEPRDAAPAQEETAT